MEELPIIATIAAAFFAAWLFGLATQWMGLSPIVGYLLAGLLIGPNTPGFVGDVHIAHQLAEIGVILLMFGVGLHFNLKDLAAVRKVAVPGAVGQSLVATILAMAVFSMFGMPPKSGAVLGMAMAVASTVVLMRVLMDNNALRTVHGHVAVGWLIVEDLFTVVLLVLIPILGSESAAGSADGPGFLSTMGTAMIKLLVLVIIVLWAGSRVVPSVLVKVARLRSRELFTLTVLVFSIAVAAASYFFFGASMALGAFLAGMVVAQSPVSHQAAADALPMRDTFAVIFFVSVGMLFDPAILIEQPLMVAAALGIILIAKPVAALAIVALVGHSSRTGLTVAIGLAQIGEFSFILSELGRRYGLIPDAAHSVLVAAAILSITINPMLFRSVPRMEAVIRRRPTLWRLLNARSERRIAAGTEQAAAHDRISRDGRTEGHVIVVGYGPVGRSVVNVLRNSGIDVLVIDLNMDTVLELRENGHQSIFGDASNPAILEQAGATRASHLVVTIPDASERAAIVAAGRSQSATLRILVRARYLRERESLERGGASAAVFEESEAAVALARMVLADTGVNDGSVDGQLRDIRMQLLMENVSNIRTQRVSSVMIPWERVHTISTTDSYQTVLGTIARHRFSRWPVLAPEMSRPHGYLLSKDLLSFKGSDSWPALVREVPSVSADAMIDATLQRMQEDGTTLCLVETDGKVVGILTLEDVVEQVVGSLNGESPDHPPPTLAEALRRGAVLASLANSASREIAIGELTAAIPAKHLPSGMDVTTVVQLVLAREQEVTTDLGNGIAVPHARIASLARSLVVIGRSTEGIPYTPGGRPVHLVFLVITPAGRPTDQLSLLGRIARLASDEATKHALHATDNPVDIERIVREFQERA
jgi:CPA2 family monovalent cation:H+ antiporter-2